MPARAERVITLGDSLTFAYEAEFGFEISIFLTGTFGDAFGPEVRNWAEILNDPTYRKPFFDLGPRRELDFGFPVNPAQTLLPRHDFNWAIPGLKVDQLRRFIQAEAGFLDLIGESPDFVPFVTALSFSNFDESQDFNLTDLEAQISGEAARMTFFIGGNDLRGIYATVYDGGSAGSFVDDFITDTTAILDRVQTLNPTLQIVVVNLPHIGITPDIKASQPTDPVKTGRVTELLRELNQRLAALAAARGLGYADVFTPTLPLLDEATFCLQGIPFANTGSTTGDLDFVWLNGATSANFHPNTNAQALIANEIIHAFNRTYGSGIAPLSATEMLGGLHGKSTAEIDMTFADWMSGYVLAGLPPEDDSDGDGISAGVEFALGLNPRLRDGEFVSSYLADSSGSPALHLSYPLRLPSSTRFTLTPAASADLVSPFTPVVAAAGADGLSRAVLPLGGASGFLRLESVLEP